MSALINGDDSWLIIELHIQQSSTLMIDDTLTTITGGSGSLFHPPGGHDSEVTSYLYPYAWTSSSHQLLYAQRIYSQSFFGCYWVQTDCLPLKVYHMLNHLSHTREVVVTKLAILLLKFSFSETRPSNTWEANIAQIGFVEWLCSWAMECSQRTWYACKGCG